MNEFELKFEIPAEHLPQILAAVHAKKAQLEILQDCYFDTKDGALAKHGLVLRMRKKNGDWIQTAKSITNDPLDRLEHNVKVSKLKPSLPKILSPNTETPGMELESKMPVIDISRHADEKIGQLIFNALNIKPDGLFPSLMPWYETDVQRLKFLVNHKGSSIEIALDQGMVVSSGRSTALCELEIELIKGNPEHVVELARTWCANHGLWLSTISKSMKGQRLHDQLVFPQLSHEAESFKHPKNGQQMVKAVFQSCLNQILPNASEIASGSQNTDHVHQLRVGIRRLRTAINELNKLAEGIDPAWEIPLMDAFRALGKHRDDDLLTRALQPQLAVEGGPNINMQRIGEDILDLKSIVQSPTFQDNLLC
ncbi:MAG: CYTH and CHAD domain-containing protein, partial [Pseudomonadota bacterium]